MGGMLDFFFSAHDLNLYQNRLNPNAGAVNWIPLLAILLSIPSHQFLCELWVGFGCLLCIQCSPQNICFCQICMEALLVGIKTLVLHSLKCVGVALVMHQFIYAYGTFSLCLQFSISEVSSFTGCVQNSALLFASFLKLCNSDSYVFTINSTVF